MKQAICVHICHYVYHNVYIISLISTNITLLIMLCTLLILNRKLFATMLNIISVKEKEHRKYRLSAQNHI